LATALPPLELRNPILSASGTFGHGLEMEAMVPPSSLGALVSKTVTLEPRPGNPMPRVWETEAGFLNSIGLENRGMEAYIADVLPTLADVDTLVVTNIGGHTPDEFVRLAEMLEGRDEVDALEVNLSCPNIQGGKLPFARDPVQAREIMRGVAAVTSKPLWAKLSPNVARIEEMAQAVEEGGASAIVAVNTLLGMAVDWRRREPRLAMVRGGYSGTAIRPVALRCAYDCASAVSIPIIGCGGIATAEHVLEFIVAGCAAVQVGTANFSDPSLLGRLASEVEALLEETKAESVASLVGTLGEAPTCV
jgi:dihydroorotate dehydrogenase (NAD+) catalytic subunit